MLIINTVVFDLVNNFRSRIVNLLSAIYLNPSQKCFTNMRNAVYFAIASGLLLLFSGTLNAHAAMIPTDITMELSSSKVNVDDIVTVSGSLTSAATGEGLPWKPITIYRDGPIGPEALATTTTGAQGQYSVELPAKLERNRGVFITVFAQFDGDNLSLPSRTGKSTFTIELKPLELVITTDGNKNRYMLGEKAFFSVALSDGSGNFVDPDFLRGTYDGKFMELTREDVGRYTFETTKLVKFEQHQFGIFAEKWGFKSAQKSITVTVFGTHDLKPVKVTASKRGDDIRIMVKNSDLSPNNIYSIMGTFIGATATDGKADKWQFSVDSTTNSFTFKTIEGYLAPGQTVIFKIKADGTPSKLVWKAFDLYGKEHTTVRDIVAAGSTLVRPIRM